MVDVYLGSYGNPEKCWQINIGRIRFFIQKNPFWREGMVAHDFTDKIENNILIILMGPLFTLLVGIFTCLAVFYWDLHGSLKLLSVFLMGSCALDFYVNIIPRKRAILLYNGTRIFNDGRQLQMEFELWSYAKEYQEGLQFWREDKVPEAIKKFSTIIDAGVNNEPLLRFNFNLCISTKDFAQADRFIYKIEKNTLVTHNDYTNFGYVKSMLHQQKIANIYYEQALQLHPNDPIALNNLGYQLLIKEKYKRSLTYFTKAIESSPNFAYPYNNRGLARIKLGDIQAGLADIEYSKQLLPENAYLYKNLGIYEYDLGNFVTALAHFQKAKEMDADTYEINLHIKSTLQRIDMLK